MHPADPRLARRRTVARALLLLLLGAATLTLMQCRLVGDRLTGVGVSLFARSSNCFAQCAATHNALIRAESQRHVQAVKDCKFEPDPEACLAAEEARHTAEVERIQAEREACENACHHQGGGTAGP